MKKCLLAFAAIALSGCAYSQFQADYLQTYAAHDCGALQSELSDALEDAIKYKKRQPGASGHRYYQSIIAPAGAGFHVGVITGATAVPSYGQKRRMRNHARQQAVLQLQTNQGCIRPDQGTGS